MTTGQLEKAKEIQKLIESKRIKLSKIEQALSFRPEELQYSYQHQVQYLSVDKDSFREFLLIQKLRIEDEIKNLESEFARI